MTVTAVHPGGSNTFQPSLEATRNMQVDFSRNPKSFALNRWLYIVPVNKMTGLYARMTVEEAGRLLNDGEDEWALGEDAPDNKGRMEKFEFPTYTTRRRQFGYRIPGETAEPYHRPAGHDAADASRRDEGADHRQLAIRPHVGRYGHDGRRRPDGCR
jgi:hypothetical protein